MIVLLAAWVVAPATTPPIAAQAQPAAGKPHLGLWVTDGGKSHVEVSECGPGICAKIVWLKDPNDDKGKPLYDGNNKNEKLRTRPIMGLPLFENMRPAEKGWLGTVYDPEEGDAYDDVTVWLSGPDKLSLKGCVLIICETRSWDRMTSAAGAKRAP